MIKHYDLVVIGSGTGASGAASRCRSAGWTVAVIDHLPFGGTTQRPGMNHMAHAVCLNKERAAAGLGIEFGKGRAGGSGPVLRNGRQTRVKGLFSA